MVKLSTMHSSLFILSIFNILRCIAGRATGTTFSSYEMVLNDWKEDIRVVFQELNVCPMLMPKPPPEWCFVQFPSGTRFNEGNLVSAKSIRQKPEVSWDALRNNTYFLVMYGLSRHRMDSWMGTIFGRYFLHWMVANIPGGHVEKGDEWFPFKKPLIPPNTITNAYVILIYQQSHRINITDPKAKFGDWFEYFPYLDVFVEQYNCTKDPIAGNICSIRF